MLHYQYYEYENGLEVVLKNADFNDAFILFGVCMGPLYESAEMSGASHFIEHLFFQTPAKGSKKKHLENLEWRGISANAETSQEYLTIEMTCSSRKTDIV
ncbi:insulinase family protein, partial [Candidatus Woesearchaeota archaeon]|nr:insulinase family protein [Candidatus Woesearchaeota archaeon]